MRVIHLSTVWTIVLDVLAWLVLQPGMAYVAARLPLASLRPEGWLYRSRAWERDGAIYQTVFAVRRWKAALPSGGQALGSFSMARLASSDAAYLRRWCVETCRAELAHWLQIAVMPLFMLWNPPQATAMLALYALAVNLPCIIAQRYNRPRLQRALLRATSACIKTGGLRHPS